MTERNHLICDSCWSDKNPQANWPKYHDFDSFPASLQVREYPDARPPESE